MMEDILGEVIVPVARSKPRENNNSCKLYKLQITINTCLVNLSRVGKAYSFS